MKTDAGGMGLSTGRLADFRSWLLRHSAGTQPSAITNRRVLALSDTAKTSDGFLAAVNKLFNDGVITAEDRDDHVANLADSVTRFNSVRAILNTAPVGNWESMGDGKHRRIDRKSSADSF